MIKFNGLIDNIMDSVKNYIFVEINIKLKQIIKDGKYITNK